MRSTGSTNRPGNGLDESPWGGWSDGAGIKTRELGRRLGRYGIRAKPIRIDGERAGNGYERSQFEDAWTRYLPYSDISTGTTGTSGFQSQESAEKQPVQEPSVPAVETPANPHEQRDVPVVRVSFSENGVGEVGQDEIERLAARARPLPGDGDFLDWIAAVHRAGHMRTGEALERERHHKLVQRAREVQA
jgi:hypothetical protein